MTNSSAPPLRWLREGPTPRVKYQEEAAALRDNPGCWATVLTAESPNAAWCHQQAIRTGRRAAFRPAGAYEAVARGCDVIARYVGVA